MQPRCVLAWHTTHCRSVTVLLAAPLQVTLPHCVIRSLKQPRHATRVKGRRLLPVLWQQMSYCDEGKRALRTSLLPSEHAFSTASHGDVAQV